MEFTQNKNKIEFSHKYKYTFCMGVNTNILLENIFYEYICIFLEYKYTYPC